MKKMLLLSLAALLLSGCGTVKKADYDALDAQVKELQLAYSRLHSSESGYKKENENLKAELASCQSELEALRTETEAQSEKIAEYSEEIRSLEIALKNAANNHYEETVMKILSDDYEMEVQIRNITKEISADPLRSAEKRLLQALDDDEFYSSDNFILEINLDTSNASYMLNFTDDISFIYYRYDNYAHYKNHPRNK